MMRCGRKRIWWLRQLAFERCESRRCLSTVAFAAHDIECCAAEDAEFVVAADLDGDGDVDVLSASRMNDKIAWYENVDGLGNFGPQQVIDMGPFSLGPVFVTTADLDGDGDLDVLSATSFNEGKIAWYENVDGRGGFGRQQVITAETDGARWVGGADLDGDGDMDVLSGTSSGASEDQLAWYENIDGLGTFGPSQVISTGAKRIQSVAVGDVDGDGDLDVMSASTFDNKVAWYENTDSLGAFGSERVISTEADGAHGVTMTDVDADGDLDVLVASRGNSQITWHENLDASGTFGPRQVITTEALGAYGVAAADLDGDGDVDVLSASTRDGKIAWYENTDGRGTFGPQQVITVQTLRATSVAAADLDGDGDLDVLSASYGDHNIAWYENTDGLGVFGSQRLLTTRALGANSVEAADLDGDGDLDVLFASDAPLQSKLAWYENTGGGMFGPPRMITALVRRPLSMQIADLDGDGDLDLLSASFEDRKIAWYENIDGSGNFGPQQPISTMTTGANSVVAADLDGDGDLDVVTGSYSELAWHENTDGRGNFGPQQRITGSSGTSIVVTADLDADGDLDILSASNESGIVWYENIGSQRTFGPERVISTEVISARSLAAADLDGDGDLDVVTASHTTGTYSELAWQENTDGLGNFGPRQVISSAIRGAQSVAATDVDGDGNIDVLSASIHDGKLAWYANTDGLGTFGPQQVIDISPSGRGSRSVVPADVDNDGDMDVLFASFSRITWYEPRIVADVNGDGLFNSSDLVLVFQAGEYEDRIVRNSNFGEGDWNGDGEFDSSDLVLAFQAGHFERAAASRRLTNFAPAVDRLFAETDGKRSRGVFAP